MSLTFTKLFSSITDSSIWCEDSDTKVVWVTMLAMADEFGRVLSSVPGLAKRANVSVEATRKALDKFLAPDPDSRSRFRDPNDDGRRIEVTEMGWRLLNHSFFRELRNDEDRREQNRLAQQRHRERVSKMSANVSTGQQMSAESAHTEADTEADADQEQSKRGVKSKKAFQKPSCEECEGYAKEIGMPSDEGRKFFDHFTSNGWKVGGKSPMRDWRAALRTWKGRWEERNPKAATKEGF